MSSNPIGHGRWSVFDNIRFEEEKMTAFDLEDCLTRWRHSTVNSQWEYGWYDAPRGQWVTYAFVTDEFLEGTYDSVKKHMAVKMHRVVGSVPSPLQEFLPPDPEST